MTEQRTEIVAHSPRLGWDSDLFLLAGQDRAELMLRVEDLLANLEAGLDLDLFQLAGNLARTLPAGGSRLAIVASSSSDLIKRLKRASSLLADPNCHQIRDTGGTYFFSNPLGSEGTVALLFPGEGAQYLNMLADLCAPFPEVEETFAWCDEVAIEAGNPEASLRRILHISPDASKSERDAAEAQLRRLGPSIFGVLLADQAIFRILQKLQLPISAVGGHSAGELGALLASGAMESHSVLAPHLSKTMEMMERQEDEESGSDVRLLAVGAGRAVVEAVAATISSGVIVAMDNCPHQCVAVGPTALIEKTEAELTGRGIICEILPFRRPYHTPLFEPWMGPFRELFGNVPFGESEIPLYSCSTGGRFPSDPEQARQLAVNHWVRPVEFARMIETMYEDGVRLFVECGPRGNLSAFVEDILRGKPVAALPANVLRKSGPTQINHLVAQLVAHHVPLDLSSLYPSSLTERFRWEDLEENHSEEMLIAAENEPISPVAANNIRVMNNYLGMMEKFLDVQHEVMHAFLGGSTEVPAAPFETIEPITYVDEQEEEIVEEHLYCLIGKIVHFEPGQEIVFHRVLDEKEDLYVDDHTLGGRGVSRVDPAQNGLPVLPMTFSLEAMSQAASLLIPGKVVVGISNIRLYRWIPFDPEPTTLEVRASVDQFDPESGRATIRANVRDLGNSFLIDGANKIACEAIVVLGDRFPPSPEPLPFELTGEISCRATVDDLRRNMFHGPLFQMIRALDRIGEEGIEGLLEVQPRDRWFRSNESPRVAIDPVLIDAAMHILGAWHLEQADWSGRILLPIGVANLEFFGPIPEVGSFLLIRGHNEEETARQVRHGLEIFNSDGSLWLRMTGASYWRFYLPFGDVNFFGPKDQYFLSSRCPEVESGGEHSRCFYLEPPLDLQQPVLRASGVRVTMTPREIDEYQALPESDRSDWFFSRLLAKDAVRSAWTGRFGNGVFPSDIETHLIESRIECSHRDPAEESGFAKVAVAIRDGKVAAFAAYSEYVGVALVNLPKNCDSSIELLAREQASLSAVAEALGIDTEKLSVSRRDEDGNLIIVALPRQMGTNVRVRTARKQNSIIATTCCEADDRT